jgi:hypothetical protein
MTYKDDLLARVNVLAAGASLAHPILSACMVDAAARADVIECSANDCRMRGLETTPW